MPKVRPSRDSVGPAPPAAPLPKVTCVFCGEYGTVMPVGDWRKHKKGRRHRANVAKAGATLEDAARAVEGVACEGGAASKHVDPSIVPAGHRVYLRLNRSADPAGVARVRYLSTHRHPRAKGREVVYGHEFQTHAALWEIVVVCSPFSRDGVEEPAGPASTPTPIAQGRALIDKARAHRVLHRAERQASEALLRVATAAADTAAEEVSAAQLRTTDPNYPNGKQLDRHAQRMRYLAACAPTTADAADPLYVRFRHVETNCFLSRDTQAPGPSSAPGAYYPLDMSSEEVTTHDSLWQLRAAGPNLYYVTDADGNGRLAALPREAPDPYAVRIVWAAMPAAAASVWSFQSTPNVPPHKPYRGRIKLLDTQTGVGFIDCVETHEMFHRDVYFRIDKASVDAYKHLANAVVDFQVEVDALGRPVAHGMVEATPQAAAQWRATTSQARKLERIYREMSL